ncbi:MAG TPA: GNAT family N-acetyltransferase [Burkholderiaceae bacterium]
MTILTTARMRLEPINDSHLQGLHQVNRDPEVMRYITGRGDTLEDTQKMIDIVKERWATFGYSWWCFIELDSEEVIGAGCIQHLGRDRNNPLETGWRLRRDKWGQGFASEAAGRMAAFAFDTLKGGLLCAVCDPANTASSNVMKKLGMQYRGIERWYDLDMARYDMSLTDWLGRQAARQNLLDT